MRKMLKRFSEARQGGFGAAHGRCHVTLVCLLVLAVSWPSPTKARNAVRRLVWHDRSRVARELEIKLQRKAVFSAYRLDDPPRVVLDIGDTDFGSFLGPQPREGDAIVQSIALQELGQDPAQIGRITLQVSQEAQYSVEQQGTTLRLYTRLPKHDITAPAAPPQARQLLDLDRDPAGNIYLRFNHLDARTPLRTQRMHDPERLVIDVPQARLRTRRKTFGFGSSCIKRVRLGSNRAGVRAVFDLADGLIEDQVVQVGNDLQVLLSPSPSAPQAVAQHETPSSPRPDEAIRVAPRRTNRGRIPLVRLRGSAPQTAAFSQSSGSLGRAFVAAPNVTGDYRKRISLDVKDADILNVLRLISEETGENIIASDDVKGKVTLKLRNVPADHALDTMLRTKGFDRVRQNNILRVAPAEAIQKERDNELARRRSMVEVEETLIKMVTINYATAAEIVDQIKPMLTGRGSVQVDVRTNTIILQDIASSVERLTQLCHLLDKQTPLVMIQARIVEVSTSHAQDLGVQWGGQSQQTSRTANPTGLVFPGDVIVNGGADDLRSNQVGGVSTPAHYAVNLPATLTQGGGLGFVLGSAGGSQILNLRLSAMETSGNGRIISSPEVATLDNKTARVSQGVEIPVSVVSAAGTNTRFIAAALELEVTPHVTNDGTVLLKIKTQKSEPDFNRTSGNGDPTIQKKFAETEVLVRDGDTSVIGGIYTRNTSDTLSEVPFFARIPILGSLFRRRASQDARAELLVFITPRIINREESMIQAASMARHERDN